MSVATEAISRIVAAPVWSSQTIHGPAFVAASARDIDPDIWANAWNQHAKGSRFNEVVEQGLLDEVALLHARRANVLLEAIPGRLRDKR